jgi:esterase/lipase superfamily enzyme
MRREGETRLWFSARLGHDMELIVYGHAGQALIAFPSQDGGPPTGKASA